MKKFMKTHLPIALIVFMSSTCFAQVMRKLNVPQEFSDCLKRTEHGRMTRQSGCGIILQQCYDEASDAINAKTDALIKKQRSASCAALVRKYTDSSARLDDSVADDAGSQPGWLGADLKMNLLQQRYETTKLIGGACK
jgi:hypothetical protein